MDAFALAVAVPAFANVAFVFFEVVLALPVDVLAFAAADADFADLVFVAANFVPVDLVAFLAVDFEVVFLAVPVLVAFRVVLLVACAVVFALATDEPHSFCHDSPEVLFITPNWREIIRPDGRPCCKKASTKEHVKIDRFGKIANCAG